MEAHKKIKIDNPLKCRICNTEFKTASERNKHLKLIHNLTISEYTLKYYLNSELPKCQCGCGKETSYVFFKNIITINLYTSNHFPRKKHTSETKQKIKEGTERAIEAKYGVKNIYLLRTLKDQANEKSKQTKSERYGDPNYNNSIKNKETLFRKHGVTNARYLVKNTRTSKIEKTVSEKIAGNHKFIYENKEFDIKLNNDIFEIDGDYYHPSTLNELTLTQVQNAINDFNKNEIIKQSEFNLYKVHVSDIEKQINITPDILKDISYTPDHTITFKQKIITKSYLENYIKVKGVEKLKKYSPILLKFIRTLHPDFPYPEQEEAIYDVIKKIYEYDTSKIYRNGVFDNNSSVIGVNYLKSNSKSYWNTSYKNSLTPIQAWYNDDIMQKVIDYRVGINTSGEVFDFSLHQLIRGLSARRLTVSFFKPILAAAIYDKYLTNKINPVVFDPCAGFGGRLLGFKSKFPNGTYIGVEPSKSTYDELCKLVVDAEFTNVKLFNCKLEDLKEIPEYDLAFTSIPYYDLEKYDNDVKYDSFEEWEHTFIKKLLSLKNLYVNIPVDLLSKVKYACYIIDDIKTNTSHFAVDNSKNELIVKFI